jgi:hypothetical protein
MAAADEFDAGRIDAGQLNEVRVGAIDFQMAIRHSTSPQSIARNHAIMHRLWPTVSPDQWYEVALHFLDSCREGGLGEDRFLSVLRAHFGDVPGD